METATSTTQLQQALIERILQVKDPAVLESAMQYLNTQDTAPDELSAADWAEIDEAIAQYERGEYYTWEEVKQKFEAEFLK